MHYMQIGEFPLPNKLEDVLQLPYSQKFLPGENFVNFPLSLIGETFICEFFCPALMNT